MSSCLIVYLSMSSQLPGFPDGHFAGATLAFGDKDAYVRVCYKPNGETPDAFEMNAVERALSKIQTWTPEQQLARLVARSADECRVYTFVFRKNSIENRPVVTVSVYNGAMIVLVDDYNRVSDYWTVHGSCAWRYLHEALCAVSWPFGIEYI